jgi:quercetin dioxygenase-like cupin family protein
MNGAHLKVIVEEVTYPPGGFSKPHSHPCPVVGYVLKGAVRMQVSGSAEAIYRPGDTFFEAPNTQHVVSANASETEAATFLVYFLCDHETPLTIGLPGTGDNGGRK